MKYSRLVFAIQCSLVSILIFGSNHVYVSAQTSAISGLGPVLTAVLPHIPGKVLSLLQLSLLARLWRQNRNQPMLRAGPNGVDDGPIDEDNGDPSNRKKNVMIFLGKHNIQVSNHGMKTEGKDGEIEYEYENGDEDEEVDDEEYNDNEDLIDENQYEKDYSNKYKKGSGDEKNRYKEENKESEDNSDYYSENRPMVSNHDDSRSKPILQMPPIVPWNKKIMVPMFVTTEGMLSNEIEVQTEDPMVSDFMSAPNGFPLKSPNDYNIRRRIDRKKSSTTKHDKQRQNYEPSEPEINGLLSHPKVIEFLSKFNESLVNESSIILKKLKKRRIKRQVNHNTNDTFIIQESQQLRDKSIESPNGLITRLVPNSQPNHSFHTSSHSQKGQNKEYTYVESGSDLGTESRPKSVHKSRSIKPKIIRSFKPNSSKRKTSSSIELPTYHQMAVTDDDHYPKQYEAVKHGHNYMPHIGITDTYVFDGGHYVGHSGGHTIKSGRKTGQMPVMDLTYWSKINKKTKKKKKKTKKKKKKSKKKSKVTTEAYVTEDYDDEEYDYEYEDDYEDEYEEEKTPKSKKYSTVQVIKSGTTKGNIGSIPSGEPVVAIERSYPGWIKKLPKLPTLEAILG